MKLGRGVGREEARGAKLGSALSFCLFDFKLMNYFYYSSKGKSTSISLPELPAVTKAYRYSYYLQINLAKS